MYENIDQKGVPFVEYSYDKPNPKELWTKNTSNKQRTYSYTDFFNHAKSPNLEIKENFHLMFMGLDRINLTIKELSQEIYIKIKTLVGEISPTQIMVIDNESIRGRLCVDAADIFNSNVAKSHANLEQNLAKMGRVACVRLSNPLDAIAILAKCVKINLPLNNGTTDEPIIVPSKWLRAYIAESSTQTITPNIQTAGYAFSELNKEIEKINTEIKNMMMHNSGGDGFPRRGNNKGGKGGFKGRKGDTSNNDEVRKMGASDRGGPKGFKKNKPQNQPTTSPNISPRRL